MAAEETRRELLGVHAATLLPSAVAVLSLATGVTNISVGATTNLALRFVPEIVRETAGFTGTITGFLLLLSVSGLRRRLRFSWYTTVALLPLSALQGVVQASVYSVPLVVLSLLSLPTVLIHRRRFDRPLALSTAQTAAILALSGTLAYGTIGTFALREEYGNVDSLMDALYYTVVTASTVGYGDIVPLSDRATLFAMSLVVLGTVSFAVALGSVLGPAIEARLSHALGTMSDTQYDLFEDHVVVLGYGELTEPLLEELGTDVPYVVVTPDREEARALREEDVDVLVGDPSGDEPLHDVGIEHARAVIVATNNDAEDAFAILTARELNPDVRIVAAATVRDNIEKLRRAGADVVLSPALIGGRLLVRSALGEDDVERIADEIIDEDR
jgi:voltage-gated potassium channel